MEREWSGDPRRLSRADKAKIERLIRAGETFATTAVTVGVSEKSIQIELDEIRTSRAWRRRRFRSALRPRVLRVEKKASMAALSWRFARRPRRRRPGPPSDKDMFT